MSDFVDLSTLEESTAAALKRLVISLADSKRLMGLRYSDWVLGAPSIETGIATSSMAQDEWGHARLLYSMLKDMGVDPVAIEHERADEAYASVDALDQAFPDWAAVVAGMVLVDGALSTMLASFARGRFEPATTRVPKMLTEEEFHSSLGRAWYRRLAESASDEARGLLESATRSMLPGLLAWVGADDGPSRALVDAGLLSSAEDRLASYAAEVAELVGTAGVDLGDVAPATDWDGSRGRGVGHPQAEATERARGDLNRMLLVE